MWSVVQFGCVFACVVMFSACDSKGPASNDAKPARTPRDEAPPRTASGVDAGTGGELADASVLAEPADAQPSEPQTGAAGALADAAASGAPSSSPGRDGAPMAPLDSGTDLDLDAGRDTADAAPPPDGDCAPFVMPADCAAPSGAALPMELRCTGLYADFDRRTLACGLTEYTPAFELWSDGATKRRWVSLPPGSQVDTSDPDAFVYPVGAQFWKEFQVQVNGRLQRAETRLFRKLAAGWTFTTYVWSADGTTARQQNEGVADWNSSGHTVPTRDQCVLCHAGRRDQVLGWDPVLLGAGARGVRLADLTRASGADDDAGAAPGEAQIPGDAVERAALGYLHVNCGVSCHNPSLQARASDTGLYLRLSSGPSASVLDTAVAVTALNNRPSGNAPVQELPEPDEGPFYDLLPRSPARSLVLARMLVRDHPAQMPPVGSNVVDESGAAAIRAWIEQMLPERGYPPAAE
jgi:hypothetical protein